MDMLCDSGTAVMFMSVDVKVLDSRVGGVYNLQYAAAGRTGGPCSHMNNVGLIHIIACRHKH